MTETLIIIRTKNEDRWIKYTIEKILEQTYKKFKIVIVDNYSSDRTIEIVKKYKLKILKISHEKLKTNKDFYEDKINTATYYFDKILPRVQGHYISAVSGSESMMRAKFN